MNLNSFAVILLVLVLSLTKYEIQFILLDSIEKMKLIKAKIFQTNNDNN
jgi:hypothetical protein